MKSKANEKQSLVKSIEELTNMLGNVVSKATKLEQRRLSHSVEYISLIQKEYALNEMLEHVEMQLREVS